MPMIDSFPFGLPGPGFPLKDGLRFKSFLCCGVSSISSGLEFVRTLKLLITVFVSSVVGVILFILFGVVMLFIGVDSVFWGILFLARFGAKGS